MTDSIFHPDAQAPTALVKRILTISYLKGRVILDAGCGSGWLSIEIARRGFEVFAIDLSKKQLEQAKLLSKAEQINLTLIRASLSHMPFGTAMFDSIVSSDVIEHIPLLSVALEELSRVLRSEGNLCITTPNGYGFYEILYNYILRDIPVFSLISKTSRMLRRREIETEHVIRFTPNILRQFVCKSGFSVVVFQNTEFLSILYYFVFLIAKREKKLLHKLETTDVRTAPSLPLFLGSEWFLCLLKS
jgi:2-polyprenyl-3-methyl-5-hydroxy-6-metoxy-1,4-benzoquinol methylase